MRNPKLCSYYLPHILSFLLLFHPRPCDMKHSTTLYTYTLRATPTTTMAVITFKVNPDRLRKITNTSRAPSANPQLPPTMPAEAPAHGAPTRVYLNTKVTAHVLDGMKMLALERYVLFSCVWS